MVANYVVALNAMAYGRSAVNSSLPVGAKGESYANHVFSIYSFRVAT